MQGNGRNTGDHQEDDPEGRQPGNGVNVPRQSLLCDAGRHRCGRHGCAFAPEAKASQRFIKRRRTAEGVGGPGRQRHGGKQEAETGEHEKGKDKDNAGKGLLADRTKGREHKMRRDRREQYLQRLEPDRIRQRPRQLQEFIRQGTRPELADDRVIHEQRTGEDQKPHEDRHHMHRHLPCILGAGLEVIVDPRPHRMGNEA